MLPMMVTGCEPFPKATETFRAALSIQYTRSCIQSYAILYEYPMFCEPDITVVAEELPSSSKDILKRQSSLILCGGLTDEVTNTNVSIPTKVTV